MLFRLDNKEIFGPVPDSLEVFDHKSMG
jgi:hypothetical protein